MFQIKGSDFQWGEYGDALLKIEQSPFVCAYACVCAWGGVGGGGRGSRI